MEESKKGKGREEEEEDEDKPLVIRSITDSGGLNIRNPSGRWLPPPSSSSSPSAHKQAAQKQAKVHKPLPPPRSQTPSAPTFPISSFVPATAAAVAAPPTPPQGTQQVRASMLPQTWNVCVLLHLALRCVLPCG